MVLQRYDSRLFTSIYQKRTAGQFVLHNCTKYEMAISISEKSALDVSVHRQSITYLYNYICRIVHYSVYTVYCNFGREKPWLAIFLVDTSLVGTTDIHYFYCSLSTFPEDGPPMQSFSLTSRRRIASPRRCLSQPPPSRVYCGLARQRQKQLSHPVTIKTAPVSVTFSTA